LLFLLVDFAVGLAEPRSLGFLFDMIGLRYLTSTAAALRVIPRP